MRFVRPIDLSGIAVFLLVTAPIGTVSGIAQQPDVSVMVRADGDMDTCALGQVSGLNPNGDNFLAVRAGPGTTYPMTDKLRPGTRVWMFDEQGDWIGVAYGSDEIECSPIKQDKAYNGPGKSGWVHRKYVRLVAG